MNLIECNVRVLPSCASVLSATFGDRDLLAGAHRTVDVLADVQENERELTGRPREGKGREEQREGKRVKKPHRRGASRRNSPAA